MPVITQDEFGGSEVLRLEERPTPAPGKGELRVRVTAADVNPVDAAGGDGVTNFAPGDRVSGMPMFPEQVAAYATHVVAPAEGFAMIPCGPTDAEAAARPIGKVIIDQRQPAPVRRRLAGGAGQELAGQRQCQRIQGCGAAALAHLRRQGVQRVGHETRRVGAAAAQAMAAPWQVDGRTPCGGRDGARKAAAPGRASRWR